MRSADNTLANIDPSTKLNIGGVFLAGCLYKFNEWDIEDNLALRDYLTAWIVNFTRVVWHEILHLEVQEHTALKELLIQHLHGGGLCDSVPDIEPLLTSVRLDNFRDVVLNIILKESYNSRVRALIIHILVHLGHPNTLLKAWEIDFGHALVDALDHSHDPDSSNTQMYRRVKIGLAAVGGGLVLALTGGIAAPAVAAVFGAIGTSIASVGGAVGAAVGGAFVGTGVLVTTIGTAGAAALFGVGGASLTGWKMTSRLGDLSQFEFLPLCVTDTKNRSVEITVVVSGWLRTIDDVNEPWQCESYLTETYALMWESRQLLELGHVMLKLLRDELAKSMASLWITTTLGAAVASTFMWPVWVINSLSDLDNAWLVAKDRATLAGEMLAQAVSTSTRPVSLIGYSMGARAIFQCLLHLADSNKFDLIQDVILIGAPISCTALPSKMGRWHKARSVVAGRFVNAYSKKDWILGILYRYVEWGISVAGLTTISEPGIENVDLQDIVSTHTDYPDKMAEILKFMDIVI